MEAQPNSRYDALSTLDLNKMGADDWWSADADTSMRSSQLANAELWKWILASAGLGVAGRSALGASNLLQQEPKRSPTPSFQSVGIATPEEEEEKFAGDTNPVVGMYDTFKDSTSGLMQGKTSFTGKGSSSPWSVPALLALGVPGSFLAAAGGWKLVDKVLDSRRQSAMTNEVDTAKEEYERLLRETMVKHSADDAGIEAELDELATMATDGVEKTALGAMDVVNGGYGSAMAYALLTALLSGKFSYDHFKQRNKRDIAEEALQRRAKERSGGVAPIQLSPTPTAAPAEDPVGALA